MPTQDRERLLADVEAFCQEIRPIEELCYVEHKFNDQVLPLGRKYGLLGMSLPESYGGRPVDAITYLKALARIGREGTGVRTFFSGHISIGAYPVPGFEHHEGQKRRYLARRRQRRKDFCFWTDRARGRKQSPRDAVDLRTQGRSLRPKRRQILDLQRRHRRRDRHLCLPQGWQSAVVSAFILDTKSLGFAPRRPHREMGIAHVEHCHVQEMTNCAVPVANLLGPRRRRLPRCDAGTLTNGRSQRRGRLPRCDRRLSCGRPCNTRRNCHQHGKPIAKHQLVQGASDSYRDGSVQQRIDSGCAAEAMIAATASPNDAALKSRAARSVVGIKPSCSL